MGDCEPKSGQVHSALYHSLGKLPEPELVQEKKYKDICDAFAALLKAVTTADEKKRIVEARKYAGF